MWDVFWLVGWIRVLVLKCSFQDFQTFLSFLFYILLVFRPWGVELVSFLSQLSTKANRHPFYRSKVFSNGPFPTSFSLFLSFQQSWQQINVLLKIHQSHDSNRVPLVLESTALPTEPRGGAPSFESLFEISFSDQSQRKFWKRQFRLLSKFLAGKIEMARRERDIWKDLCTVWPDWVIYWNLGNFSKLVATMILPKSPTLLGNFCRGVKISSFFQWNHFWATFIDIWQLFTGHTAYGWTE